MARALSTQVKEFLDMWLSPYVNTNTSKLDDMILYTMYPYDHSGKFSRKYHYTVKDGFELMSKKPYEIDLMGYPEAKVYISSLVKELTGKTCEGLDKYKQIVFHYETYTGVVNLEKGTKNVVLEIHVKKEMA